MHQRRYFFLDDEGKPYDREVYSPGEVLRTIFDYAQRVNLFRELPTGTALLRARWEGCEPRWNSPEELGPPPAEKANQPNRMSPAGIPMFYACDDEDTALKETAAGAGYFAIGRFETLRAATLLDLTAIPRFPSLFDPVPDSAEVLPRTVLGFLHHVAGRFLAPSNEAREFMWITYRHRWSRSLSAVNSRGGTPVSMASGIGVLCIQVTSRMCSSPTRRTCLKHRRVSRLGTVGSS